MSQWYYADRDRQRQGPVESEELARLFRFGSVALDSLVWREGMQEWQPLSDFGNELRLLDAPDETTAEPAADTLDAIVPEPAAVASPYAPPVAAVSSDEAFHAGGEVVYAGFWKRVAAYLIDGFIVNIAAQIVQMVLMLVFFGLNASAMSGDPSGMFNSVGGILFILAAYLVPLLIGAGYYAAFHASSKQATLGKMAVGIKVVRSDGHRITLLRGIARFFGLILSGLIVGIGFLMAAFTGRKQALHDMICDTLVVDKWAYTAHPEWQRRELGTVTIVILAIFGVLILLMLAFFGMMMGVLFANLPS
ncbi:transporter [Pseudoxanthomonas kalamensis DSM 18571]|uniref:RDD family protein n=1 Tax=Pseudoxanthomonas kalamensis TaxID=289483 RepID=UPI001391DDA9|nr:RDD family protein [Pseudoxanthomonas kalamensis]KAF1712108.1 transporter [Pseudoxanthomonas kalamensis DSM 18571]